MAARRGKGRVTMTLPKLSISRIVAFANLRASDLIVDSIYEGGARGNAADDPISRLIRCGNQGGFRYTGSWKNHKLQLCVLYSELSDPDWPDSLSPELGVFVYYGDNKAPGHDIHDTKRRGNQLLKWVFDQIHTGARDMIPPFFVFTKGPKGRDVQFRGLAVPGAKGLAQTDDLVAIWKTKGGARFANYKATFTILDVPAVSRSWIEDVEHGTPNSQNAPTVWKRWVIKGDYAPLVAPRAKEHRTKQEQLPETPLERRIVDRVIRYFKGHPEGEYAFEGCAAEITRLMDPRIVQWDLTRPWRDGGRDAIGEYRIGTDDSAILVKIALEAKCKVTNSGSGVKEISRLVSRLRHRQFGVFVTTSYVSESAYKEIVEDSHPVIILGGRDIARILIRSGYNSEAEVETWLHTNFGPHNP